jgi:uncharacterized membrane protein YdfJ with MMPL/SSD domain
LWDLPLTSTTKVSLNQIAVELHKQLQNESEFSLDTKASKPNVELQRKLDIVKYIYEVRVAENAAASNAQAKAEERQELLALIKEKEREALAGTSLEELRKRVEAM